MRCSVAMSPSLSTGEVMRLIITFADVLTERVQMERRARPEESSDPVVRKPPSCRLARRTALVPERSPWLTRPWSNVRGDGRGAVAAAGYLVIGACILLLAPGGSQTEFRSGAPRRRAGLRGPGFLPRCDAPVAADPRRRFGVAVPA